MSAWAVILSDGGRWIEAYRGSHTQSVRVYATACRNITDRVLFPHADQSTADVVLLLRPDGSIGAGFDMPKLLPSAELDAASPLKR